MKLKQLPAATLAQVRAGVPKVARVTLPAPPSANALWFNVKGKGRAKTPEYRAWIASVEGLLLGLESPESYPCQFFMVLEGDWDMRRDGDNVFKSVIDTAKAAGVIVNDNLRHVVGWHGTYFGGEGEPRVTVWFEEVRRE